MDEHLNVVPDDLREAARSHREIAGQLDAASSTHPAVMATLQSLGPVFAELRTAGNELLERRRDCYRQQAAAHDELADKLCHAADVWERHDTESARRLAGPAGNGR